MYKRYILTFTGDSEAVAFLERRIKKEQPDLATARMLGRAAKTLLGVEYKVTSVTLPHITAERVKSL